MDLSKWTLMCCLLVESFPRMFGQGQGGVDYSDNTYTEEAMQIFNTIFHKYNAQVPPRKYFPKPIVLELYVNLVHVGDLDLVNQRLESTIDLQVSWIDGRLSWFPLTVKEISLTKDRIWFPDLTITNAIDKMEEVDGPNPVVGSTGRIYWYKRMKVATFCATNITGTSHTCEITIGSHLLDDSLMDFDQNISKFVVEHFPSHKWDVMGSESMRRSTQSTRKPNTTYTEFVCSVELQPTGCCGYHSAEPLGSSERSNLKGDTSGVAASLAMSLLSLITLALFSMTIAQY